MLCSQHLKPVNSVRMDQDMILKKKQPLRWQWNQWTKWNFYQLIMANIFLISNQNNFQTTGLFCRIELLYRTGLIIWNCSILNNTGPYWIIYSSVNELFIINNVILLALLCDKLWIWIIFWVWSWIWAGLGRVKCWVKIQHNLIFGQFHNPTVYYHMICHAMRSFFRNVSKWPHKINLPHI